MLDQKDTNFGFDAQKGDYTDFVKTVALVACRPWAPFAKFSRNLKLLFPALVPRDVRIAGLAHAATA